MKQMRKISIIWGTILVIIVILLTVLGFLYKDKRIPYKELEQSLVEDAKKYVDVHFLYPQDDSEVKVSYEEMKDEEYVSELKYGEDVCDGYVVVKSNGTVFEYKGYITCEQYTTKGYQ